MREPCEFPFAKGAVAACHAVLIVLVLASAGLADGAESPSGKGEKDARVHKLIEQLGHPEYAFRQKAEKELAAMGPDALDAIEAATLHEDLEISSRARYLLQQIQQQWLTSTGPKEVNDLLKDYPTLDANARRARIRRLGELPDGLGIQALCRILRSEQSAILAKYAAVEILRLSMPQDPPDAATVARVRENLAGTRRPAAKWLLAWMQFASQPAVAIGEWKRLTEDERKLLIRRTKSQSRPDIVAELLTIEIAQLEKLERRDEVPASIDHLFALERRDTQSLLRLAEALRQRRVWSAVEEIGTHFPAEAAAHPVLLYDVAEAQLRAGKATEAEKTAAKARASSTGNAIAALRQRYALAHEILAPRGLFDWAEKEYRNVIAGAAQDQPMMGVVAQSLLASMYHERGENLKASATAGEAVQALQSLVKRTPAPRKTAKVPGSVEPELNPAEQLKAVTSQMHYYAAMHWLAQGDKTRHRQCLEKSFEADPTNIDALIDCYRLDGPAEFHQKVVAAIRAAANSMRAEALASAQKPGSFNNYAWLIGNTEGNFDEALRFAQKAVELEPDEGGYYDTLAQVYFAMGDHEAAVKQQTKAAQLLPYSPQIASRLEVFKRWLAEKKPAALSRPDN
jgi:tetratricopeptide (TPR) repeat protein